ncbi:MAG: nicotinate-nucleotide--dimethylbenzimidazole phosphoribosyltransferase [Pseudomonadota bacterium]
MLEALHIPAPPKDVAEEMRALVDAKTKPQGSLGRVEDLAVQMAVAQGGLDLDTRACLVLFAGDHGLVGEGVSAWPADVTAQMVQNFLAGGAAANAFARTHDAGVIVADAGVAGPLPDHPDLHRARIRQGTRNARHEDALTVAEVTAALQFGADLAAQAARDHGVVALGEMGIGNTSTAALLAHAVAEIDLAKLTGPGAGLDPDGVAQKLEVLRDCARRRPGPLDPLDALAAFGGLEIAALCGAIIGAAAARRVVLVDGFIASAAALLVLSARSEVAAHLIFGHLSHEPGHRAMMRALEVRPLLDLDLRLGEGSGALLALPLLRAAAAMVREMATFDSAGVSGKAD